MQALGEIHDGVNPVTKTANTLQSVEDHAVTEDQLVLFRIGPAQFQIKRTMSILKGAHESNETEVNVVKSSQPVCESQNEELNKGRFKEQLLVLCAEICESRDGFSPDSYHIQRARQQVIKLLDVTSILLFFQVDNCLLVLRGKKWGESVLLYRTANTLSELLTV